MAKGPVILVLAVFLVAVAAAAVVSTPERESGYNVPKVDADLNVAVFKIGPGNDKSTLTDVVSSIGTQVAAATDQAIVTTSNFINNTFGGVGGFIQAIQNFLSGSPNVVTTTEENEAGSVVFLVHSKPKI